MKTNLLLSIVLTVLLKLVGTLFCVTGYEEVVPHPQFSDLNNMHKIGDLIASQPQNMFYYKSYFILDLIWAPVVLYLIFSFMNSRLRTSKEGYKEMAILPIAFLSAAVLAYGFDVLENFGYFCFDDKSFFDIKLQTIIKWKLAFYIIVLVILFIFIFQRYISERLNNIRTSIRASSLSLLIIFLILLLATQMDQGSTVIIALMEDPVSLLIAIVYVMVLAMACAHYPDYLSFRLNPGKDIKWSIQPDKLYCKTGLGFILYSFARNATSVDERMGYQRQVRDNVKFFDHFRKNLGTLLLLIWIYALLFVFDKYDVPYIPMTPVFIGCLAVSMLCYMVCHSIKKKWQEYFKKFVTKDEQKPETQITPEQKKQIEENIPRKIKLSLHLMIYCFYLLILFTGITVYLGATSQWEITSVSLLLTSIVSLLFFISFQHFRKIFTYYTPPDHLRWLGIHKLSDDLTYIQTYAVMGWAAFIIVIAFTFQPSILNALAWILLFFFVIYGIIIVLIKHYLFYKGEFEKGVHHFPFHWMATFFYRYVPVLAFLILGWVLFAGQAGNGLHVLFPVHEDSNKISYESYIETLKHNLDSNQNQSVYFVASYGGGLRATAWTMLLLNKLERSNSEFLNTTAAMSGASGGFLGLSFYQAIMAEYQDSTKRIQKIDKISRHNMLGIDVSYLFGFDFIREQFPYINRFYQEDRAGRSMQEYAALIQPDATLCDSFLKTSYRNYWAHGFKYSSTNYLPVLIGNTTGTHSRYGVAFPISSDKEQFSKIFPGAIDILSLRDSTRSISYLDATSTTERFPVFSPSAQIEEKGHFLDGGYFENSGLLSLMNFHDYLAKSKDSIFKSDTAKIILIINSKDAYVRKVLGDTVLAKKEIATGELFSILTTVTDVDILPLALEARYRQEFKKNFIAIYLPFKISFQDVEGLIRGTPINPFDVQETINASNEKIDDAWKEYNIQNNRKPVPPALARVLSDPGVDYLNAMLHHKEVKDALSLIR